MSACIDSDPNGGRTWFMAMLVVRETALGNCDTGDWRIRLRDSARSGWASETPEKPANRYFAGKLEVLARKLLCSVRSTAANRVHHEGVALGCSLRLVRVVGVSNPPVVWVLAVTQDRVTKDRGRCASKYRVVKLVV